MNRGIHSVICKPSNIVWWSSQVQMNLYTSRSFLDHVPYDSGSPPSFLPPVLPWLVSSHISVSHFSSYVSSCLQHAVSWPSSMASTHWEHCFVCWSKTACFEPCTWSQSMMMSECHLLAVPWKMVTMLSPSLCCLVLFCFSSCTTHYCLCCGIAAHFLWEIQEICVQHAGLHSLGFFVNSDNPTTKPHVFLFHFCR